MRVGIWGNNLAVRLPATVVKALGLPEGDEIEIEVATAGIATVIASERSNPPHPWAPGLPPGAFAYPTIRNMIRR